MNKYSKNDAFFSIVDNYLGGLTSLAGAEGAVKELLKLIEKYKYSGAKLKEIAFYIQDNFLFEGSRINANYFTDYSNSNLFIESNESIFQCELDKYDTILEEARIWPNMSIEKPPVFLTISFEDKIYDIGHEGDFSLVIGKAKAKKTFYLSSIIAASICRKKILDKIEATRPEGKTGVLYFDTEQSQYSVSKVLKRIERLAEYSEDHKLPNDFRVYGLRKYHFLERLNVIEHAINSFNSETNQLRFVVIDGARDLVSSINDEEQATKLSSKLMQWSEDYKIHIIVVLHQNKGNDYARGHLGTELVNKAETVFTVERQSSESDTSIVKFTDTRGETPPDFAFYIDDNGLPQLDADWQPSISQKAKKQNIDVLSSFKDNDYIKFAETVFTGSEKLKYKDLQEKIKSVFTSNYQDIGLNKAGEIITILKDRDIIFQNEKRGPYSFSSGPEIPF